MSDNPHDEKNDSLEYVNDPWSVFMPPVVPLPELIAKLRRSKGMSQQDLAARMGNPRGQAQISRYENISEPEIPDEQTILRIAEALGVPPGTLLRARLMSSPQRYETEMVDPRWVLLYERMIKLDPPIFNAVVIFMEGAVRLVEIIAAHYKRQK